MNAASLTAALKEEALRLGFDLAAATPAIASPDFDHFQQWLDDGYAGEMHYLGQRRPCTDRGEGDSPIFADHGFGPTCRSVPVPAKIGTVPQRRAAYRHPGQVLDGAKSILMLATNYRTAEPIAPGPGQAVVSRYAWGADYHELIGDRLRRLADFHRRLTPGAAVRGVVDTAPLLERQFARLAGLGWIGKNTLLINERFGSWLLLAALLTTEELTFDPATDRDPCGSCRACLDACPTGALVAPRRLDARRCISYLTVESRTATPEERRAACGNRLLGCDACQEACPWNRSTPATAERSLYPGPGMNPVELAELAALDDDAFRVRFRHTPLWRARRGIRAAVLPPSPAPSPPPLT